MKIIAYVRVSTVEQADSRAGLDAQRAAILREAERRGWAEADVEWIEDAGFSAKSLKRPGLGHPALDRLTAASITAVATQAPVPRACDGDCWMDAVVAMFGVDYRRGADTRRFGEFCLCHIGVEPRGADRMKRATAFAAFDCLEPRPAMLGAHPSDSMRSASAARSLARAWAAFTAA